MVVAACECETREDVVMRCAQVAARRAARRCGGDWPEYLGQAWERLDAAADRYDSSHGVPLAAFLHGCAKRWVIDLLRARRGKCAGWDDRSRPPPAGGGLSPKAEHVRPYNLHGLPGHAEPASPWDPGRRVDNADEVERLAWLGDRVCLRCGEVVRHLAAGFNQQETARRIGVSKGNVSRMVRLMRRVLGPERGAA